MLQFRSYNPSFTRLEIWFRFVFLLCTFIVTVSRRPSLFLYNFGRIIFRFFFPVLVLPQHEEVLGRALVAGTEMDGTSPSSAHPLQR